MSDSDLNKWAVSTVLAKGDDVPWTQAWVMSLGRYEMGSEGKTEEQRMNELLGEGDTPAKQALYQKSSKAVIGVDKQDIKEKKARAKEVRKIQKKEGIAHDIIPATEDSNVRLAFIKHVSENAHVPKTQQPFQNKPTTMEELLGKEGLKLYQAACAEENGSRAFRNAVFLSSTQSYDGPKWAERLVVWVGGPSASGKSFGTEGLINQLNDTNSISRLDRVPKDDPNYAEQNHVVSIDGGKEREMSQMRQMVLQLALAQGYSGISDLEDYSKNIKTKSFVQKAVLEDGKLNMVVPATFTSPGSKMEKMMNKFAEQKGTRQIFAQVRGVPSNDNFNGLKQFRETVKRMGLRRAFRLALPPNAMQMTQAQLLKPNNRKIGVESKNYNPGVFKFGLIKSNEMREKYKKICEKHGVTPNYYEITNDLIFVKKDANDQWVKCTKVDSFNAEGIVMINDRAFKSYNEYKDKIQDLTLKDFSTQIYVVYDTKQKLWAKVELNQGEQPPKEAVQMPIAALKIAQYRNMDALLDVKHTWDKNLVNVVGAKSIVTKNGYLGRPKDQKDKNEEKMNAKIEAGKSLASEKSLSVSMKRKQSTVTRRDSVLPSSEKTEQKEEPVKLRRTTAVRRLLGKSKVVNENLNVSANIGENKILSPPDPIVQPNPILDKKVEIPAEVKSIIETQPGAKPLAQSRKRPKKDENDLLSRYSSVMGTKVLPALPVEPEPVLQRKESNAEASLVGLAAINNNVGPPYPFSSLHVTPNHPKVETGGAPSAKSENTEKRDIYKAVGRKGGELLKQQLAEYTENENKTNKENKSNDLPVTHHTFKK